MRGQDQTSEQGRHATGKGGSRAAARTRTRPRSAASAEVAEAREAGEGGGAGVCERVVCVRGQGGGGRKGCQRTSSRGALASMRVCVSVSPYATISH